MKITRLQPQTKRIDRVSVFVDGKYAFSLARDQIVELGLKQDQDIDLVKVRQHLADSAYGKLRDQTYNWLSIRLRSKWEVEDYLKRKSQDEDLRQRVLNLLIEQGYINDDKFTGAWIRHRTLIKPISKRRLKQELMQKRVPIEIIDHQLTEQPLNDIEAIKQLVAKRGHRYPDKQKLMAYLSRQGFDYSSIKSALTEE